jgi:hypothetical protein
MFSFFKSKPQPPKRPARRSSRTILVARAAGELGVSSEEIMAMVSRGDLQFDRSNGQVFVDSVIDALAAKTAETANPVAFFRQRTMDRQFDRR